LGSFLFSGDDTEKKVQVLSGGEKTRLSLCKLLLQPNNFLILDEPTNHLDMFSKEILKDALASYQGTLLLVSHDRGFLDGLTDRVYFIKDKTIKVYHEPVTQFINSYYGGIDNEIKEPKKQVDKPVKKNKKNQNQQKSLERKITSLEEKQTSLEFELYETNDSEKLKELQAEIKKIKIEIEQNFEALMSIGN
jgi:ATP-binding cassette subfamily F protein 3